MTSWNNPDAIREDLESFQGGLVNDEIQAIHHLPPRVIYNGDDEVEEIRRQFGAMGEEDHRTPDLDGIMTMINMVEECDGLTHYKNDERDTYYEVVLTKPNTQVKELRRAALNPNVVDFVPRPVAQDGVTNNKTSRGMCADGNVQMVTENVIGDEHRNEILNNNKINNEVESKASEIEKLSNELKSKITSNGSYREKLDRNIALAKLMKLHSKEPPKLLTPQHFAPKPDQATDGQPSKTPTSVDQVKCSPLMSSNSTVLCPKFEQVQIEKNTDAPTAKDIAESVSKVENWMEKDKDTEKGKTMRAANNYTPSLTVQFIYKKKVNTSSETDQSINKNSSTSNASCRPFVPSGVANEMLKKFQKHQQAIEKQEDLKHSTIWTIAEKEMKQKEEQMRLKAGIQGVSN